ncbi:MAG: DUF1553 domain-containing protein [Verrucomicrobia bacterium]|nr:DUF1553 domain-containing protein [Verrucomicrobiota bacterium]
MNRLALFCGLGFAASFASAASAIAAKAPASPDAQVSFVNDVLPVLSKAGCNAGTCHAKADGKGGFKLSVFAYDPRADFYNITRAARGRRISPASPEQSLLLLKPTMAVQHGGGPRFAAGSPAHSTILKWIRQGMPYATPDEPALTEVRVSPAENRCKKGATQPLRVTAKFSDGSTRDVTALSHFISNEKEIATVDDAGVVKVGIVSGEGIIVARYMGLVDIARVTVPTDKPLPDSAYAALPRNNFIDDLAYARFKKLGLLPSAPCTDSEFLRRASLDAIGTLPTPDETRAFLADTDPGKRTKLIDRLLTNPAWADHWAIKWADLVRPSPFRVGVRSTFMMDAWLRESFRANKPFDQFARELLTAEGSTHRYGPVVFYRHFRDPVDIAPAISQVFLGVRLDCARCHHHPNERWGQEDFFSFAAFFTDIRRKGQGISTPISGEPEYIWFAEGRSTLKHPVTGAVMKPAPLAGAAMEIPTTSDPRAALADWMTEPGNPFFARAVANRVWAEFFGRGIVDPVDDFRASNPPTHEPLLDALAKDFAAHKFDLKHAMRTVMRSHLYQLSSLPNESNIADTKNFSRAYRRRLPAEVLADAVASVTGVPDNFQGLPAGARALEAWNNRLASDTLDAFGRPNASADCPCERDTRTSVVQALHLMNSTRLHEKISSSEGRAARLAASTATPAEIITELYLAALNRPPVAEELSIASRCFGDSASTRQPAIEDVMWALLNSAEFVFNH